MPSWRNFLNSTEGAGANVLNDDYTFSVGWSIEAGPAPIVFRMYIDQVRPGRIYSYWFTIYDTVKDQAVRFRGTLTVPSDL